ncbi:hypothetical protein RRG08_012986 [Elysia crispata]|uniref:Uncharacterized protein n=1 Tax=Elysia crispata TaxID=231223 RepID=A0AAE0ZZZ2_9GAST|nr:hypothetical protein RRG08_012986 [Elysia crispata]
MQSGAGLHAWVELTTHLAATQAEPAGSELMVWPRPEIIQFYGRDRWFGVPRFIPYDTVSLTLLQATLSQKEICWKFGEVEAPLQIPLLGSKISDDVERSIWPFQPLGAFSSWNKLSWEWSFSQSHRYKLFIVRGIFHHLRHSCANLLIGQTAGATLTTVVRVTTDRCEIVLVTVPLHQHACKD